jgi:hypothetical protein
MLNGLPTLALASDTELQGQSEMQLDETSLAAEPIN